MVKTESHRARKQEILEAAFLAWGGNRYSDTSLSVLASSLNITKQALYRYFPSKDKLEQAMEDAALDGYAAHARQLLDKLANISGDLFAETYFGVSVEYLVKNWYRLVFLCRRNRQSGMMRFPAKDLSREIAGLALKKAGIPEVGMRYLDVLVFLEARRTTAEGAAGDCWRSVWNEGFTSGGFAAFPDFHRILQAAYSFDYGPSHPDPLLSAVFDAIAEEGDAGVSLRKISRSTGLAKSNLYNYWPTKEAMLKEVLGEQMSNLNDSFNRFAADFPGPAGRLFAYLAFRAVLFHRKREFVGFMHRLMAYGISVPSVPAGTADYLTVPMEPILNGGCLQLRGYSPLEFCKLVNLSGTNEATQHLAEESSRIRADQCLKDLYLLITGGIKMLRRNSA